MTHPRVCHAHADHRPENSVVFFSRHVRNSKLLAVIDLWRLTLTQIYTVGKAKKEQISRKNKSVLEPGCSAIEYYNAWEVLSVSPLNRLAVVCSSVGFSFLLIEVVLVWFLLGTLVTYSWILSAICVLVVSSDRAASTPSKPSRVQQLFEILFIAQEWMPDTYCDGR